MLDKNKVSDWSKKKMRWTETYSPHVPRNANMLQDSHKEDAPSQQPGDRSLPNTEIPPMGPQEADTV